MNENKDKKIRKAVRIYLIQGFSARNHIIETFTQTIDNTEFFIMRFLHIQ